MGTFDFNRFNSFVKNSLDDLLFADLWNNDIFNERDMHAAAYYYIRTYFRKQKRDSVYVRCEPPLNNMKPDIVVYQNSKPIYIFELKCFVHPDSNNVKAIEEDLSKLSSAVKKLPFLRWAFFCVIYDDDKPYNLSNARLRKDGYHKITVSAINMRRQENNNRLRIGYHEWRDDFDKLLIDHRKYS